MAIEIDRILGYHFPFAYIKRGECEQGKRIIRRQKN